MSFPFYGKLWIATKKDLKNVLLREKVLPHLEPTMDRFSVHRLVGNIFTRYIVLCNNLSELYDQTLQVQKRQVIEKILMASTKRMLELQKEMQKIEMSEFVYLDDALIELKLTTQDVEFLRPFYFPRKRDLEVQQMIDEVSKVSEPLKPKHELKGLEKYRKVLKPEEREAERLKKAYDSALTLIKAHEKARQSRIMSMNILLFPETFKPKPHEPEPFHYDFIHEENQIPLHRIKRSNYKTNLYAKSVNIVKFKYYEPPTFRINQFGQKVMVKKQLSQMLEQSSKFGDELESEDDEKAKKIEEEKTLKAKAELEEKRILSAKVIQRSYRHYRLQKALKHRNWKRLEMCGLVRKPDDHEKPKQKEIDEKLRYKRRERKKEFDERFIKALEDEKARILKLKSDCIMQDISDDIRQWFREFYDGTKNFHRYPEEFEGGTIMVVRGETKTIEEFNIEKNKTPAVKAKEKAERKKKKKEQKALKKKEIAREKKEELARIKLEKKQGPTWNFADKKYLSTNLDDLERSFNDYENEWNFVDEMENRIEAPIWDWVTIDAYADVHKELRSIVDDFMRIELELLRFALAVDNKTKYVPPKHKKPKKEKKRKREPSVDITEGRSLEECYEELKSLNAGDLNYAAFELRMMNKSPVPHYGDVKNILQSLVTGMGPLELPKVKSLCIAGPPKCGKKFLVDALCTEMDAVMFDLSPIKVAPISDMDEFLSFVMQMAKKLQPSVIFIDGAHKPFIKKIEDEEKSEIPRKLGGFLLKKIVKNLTNEDAILLMATTNQPWNCNYAQLRQCFEKIVMIPPTLDYGTALMAWNKGLEIKKISNFNASPLAQTTRNFTVGDILDLIDRHVDLRRRMKFQIKPLTCDELLENLIRGPNAKKKLDEKTIKVYQQFAFKIDSFLFERYETMARVQVEIDKEKEAQAKRQEILNKKKALAQ